MERIPQILELARVFLRLGATALGGPAAHIAIMNEEFVNRRRWLSAGEFLDMIAAANLIPGPNSTEVALHIGHRRAGLPGMFVAGLCFIGPAAIVVCGLAALYVRYGVLPRAEYVLHILNPVVIALVAKAAWDLAGSALRSAALAGLGTAAAVASLAGLPELPVLLLCGCAAAAAVQSRRLPAVFLAGPAAAAAGAAGNWPLFLYFLKVGSVLYGSGYVLIALLQADLVNRLGWITQQQLLDAVTIGQITPGPLFTTATFIGYLLLGIPGAVVATVGIFLPSFVFVGATHRLVRKARSIVWMSSFLDGVNAAALALILVVTWRLAQAGIVDAFTAAIALGSAVLLIRFGIASWWLIGGAVLAGLIVPLFQ